MKKLFLLLDNISIRRKFLIVYVFCVCLPVVAGAIVWMTFTSREIQLNTTHYLEQVFAGTVNDFLILGQTAVNIGDQINADRSIRNDLSKSFSSPAEHYELYWESLRGRFDMYLVSNPDIAEITLYIDDPHFINCDHFRVIDSDVRKSDWYLTASQSEDTFVIYPDSTSISIAARENRITIIRKIKNPDYLHNAANYLLIELRLDRFIAGINQETDSISTYLTASGDKILWSTPYVKKNFDGSHAVLELPSDRKYYTIQKEIGPNTFLNGLKITGVFDKNQVYKRQFAVSAYILLITLALALFSVFLIWLLLNSMRYRISALSTHIKNIGDGHFEPLPLDNPGVDEVGWLIMAFNNMIAEINDLINVVYKLEMQKKDVEVENMRAEYKYLQAQVDPHFLFNTLNAVLVFCVKNGYTELSTIISSLSKLLKRLLTTGGNTIPVSEEFNFIDKYLTIENFRFGDKFQYEIQITPEVSEENWMIPNMSIQPIVENACKHGLQSISGNRRLIVKAEIGIEEGNSALIISVIDNGAGMDERKVSSILDCLKNDGHDEMKRKAGECEENENDAQIREEIGFGIGLQNVYRRMNMNYGDKFQFAIHSVPGQGTEVVMRIYK